MSRMLEGKTAVVTGCLKGIGYSTMELFAKEGANVWACCQYKDNAFETYIEGLASSFGITITPLYFDLANEEEIKAAMKTIISAKKPVDVLVNIAGMTQNSLFSMTTMDSMRKLFEVDFFSQMLITQYISKLMVRANKGSIITISSVTATDGNMGQVSYAAAKAALLGASATLAIELGVYGIRVNVVSPGVIKTSMTTELPEDKMNELINRCKISRAGLPEEVAQTLLFLASDKSSYITGQNIRVDGGMSC